MPDTHMITILHRPYSWVETRMPDTQNDSPVMYEPLTTMKRVSQSSWRARVFARGDCIVGGLRVFARADCNVKVLGRQLVRPLAAGLVNYGFAGHSRSVFS
jgi:hypothetical protein